MIRVEDLQVDVFRRLDEKVNQTGSGVRITHIPTGTAVCSESERSVHANRRLALMELIRKLSREAL